MTTTSKKIYGRSTWGRLFLIVSAKEGEKVWKLNIFIILQEEKTTEFELCYEDFMKNEKVFTKYLGDGLRYELSDFVSAINGNPRGGFKLTRKESAAFADIMEKFLVWRKATPIKEGKVIV